MTTTPPVSTEGVEAHPVIAAPIVATLVIKAAVTRPPAVSPRPPITRGRGIHRAAVGRGLQKGAVRWRCIRRRVTRRFLRGDGCGLLTSDPYQRLVDPDAALGIAPTVEIGHPVPSYADGVLFQHLLA